MTEPMGRTRRRWPVFVPFALAVGIAVAWSIAWYLAARRAEAMITAWIEQEARLGRVHRCGARTSGGYPFRIVVRCVDPAVELATAQPPRVIAARELLGVAQVYQPDLVIAEITGPLSIAEAGQPALWRADWRLAQASLRGVAGRPARLSLVLDEIKLERMDAAAVPWAAASHLEVHLRRGQDPAPDQQVLEVAARVGGATVASATALAGRQLDGELNALLRGPADLRPQKMATRLQEWQAAGGRLQVTKLRLQQGEAVAVAAGDIGLTAAGRPDGAFNITMAGFDRLVQDVVGGGQAGALPLGLVAGLSLLGRPAEIDGKRAVSLPLRVKDGAVYLGPIPLGKVEPLY